MLNRIKSTLNYRLIDRVIKVIVVLLVDVKYVFQIVCYILILAYFVKIFLKSPKYLSYHVCCCKVIEPGRKK